MAKQGKGDPRWIVEEREDAKNVNNWHWTERDISQWSKDKLKQLLEGVTFGTEDAIQIKIKRLSSANGEGSINNRKGKLLFFYEWNLKLEFKGETSSDTLHGKVLITGLSDENTMDDIEIDCEMKDGKDEDFALARNAILNDYKHIIIGKIQEFIEAMKSEPAFGMQYQSKVPTKTAKMETTDKENAKLPNKTPTSIKLPSSSPGKGSVSLSYMFQASKLEIYECFTDEGKISAYTQRPCVINPISGGEFTLLDGLISGSFISLDEPSRIEQKWRMRHWPECDISHVVIQISDISDYEVKIDFRQTNIPSEEIQRTQQGWEREFFERIKVTFGYGPSLSL